MEKFDKLFNYISTIFNQQFISSFISIRFNNAQKVLPVPHLSALPPLHLK